LRIFACSVLAFCLADRAAGNEPARLHSQREFRIGVLVSLTGSWSSLGENTVAGLQIAAEQLEATARAQHGGYCFRLLVRDTQLDPSLALAAIKDLDKRGVKIVIGPQSSAEVAMIKPYADAHICS
jgi:branched-chain amino acid transport system substrate-binding protein